MLEAEKKPKKGWREILLLPQKRKNHYIFSKIRFQYCEKNQSEWKIFNFKKRDKWKIDNLFWNVKNKREIRYRPIEKMLIEKILERLLV